MIHDANIWTSWWQDADIVIKGVFICLISLSFISWSVIIFKALQFIRLHKLEDAVSCRLQRQTSTDVELPPSSSRLLAHQMQGAQEHTVYDDNITRQKLELENQLTLLATIGNTAPFIGLLGTVWGIMHALQSLGSNTGISLEAVADPVGEALAATAMGLFAAIPAVAGYNLLIRRMRKLIAIIELNTRALLRQQAAQPKAEEQPV